jgi:selenocysteine lyase/cysteine desulfurase
MLTCKHAKFTLTPNVTYLNCAYMSPLLKEVEKAGIRGIRTKRRPFAITPEDFFLESDQLRKEFARTINASEPSRIVIIPSASYGLANVAANLNLTKGKEIIVAGEQFPSNIYPWHSLCEKTGATVKAVAPPDTPEQRGMKWNEAVLNAITESTAAVAIANFHWADGTRFDLQAIRKRTREVGALLIVDGTQSVGAFPFDVATILPDALVCAGYKWLMGPYSIGLAYYGPAFDNGTPIEHNWINRKNSEDFTRLVNYEEQYQDGALRYEVGEHSNFILVPMLLKAVQQINRWNPQAIQEYCKQITEEPILRLIEHGYQIEDEAWRGSHLFGIRLPQGREIGALKQKLAERKIFVSVRGNAIRVSPNVYNRKEDLEKFVRVLTS